jgi:hypothetical protein
MVAVVGVNSSWEGGRPARFPNSRAGRPCSRELPRYRLVKASITIRIGFHSMSNIIRTRQGYIKVDKTFA